MVIDMNETRLNTVAQLRAFLAGTLEVKFQPIRNDVERWRKLLREGRLQMLE